MRSIPQSLEQLKERLTQTQDESTERFGRATAERIGTAPEESLWYLESGAAPMTWQQVLGITSPRDEAVGREGAVAGIDRLEGPLRLPKEGWVHVDRRSGRIAASVFDDGGQLVGFARGAVRAAFVEHGRTRRVDERGPTAEGLRSMLASATGEDPEDVPVDRPLIDLGVDSITTAEFRGDVEARWGVRLNVRDVLDAPSLHSLAATIGERTSSDDATSRALPQLVPAPSDLHQPFPLNDIQYAYLVGRTDAVGWVSTPTHFYFEFDGALDVGRLEAAWRQVVQRHDVLRAVFLPSGEQQILEDAPDFTVDVVDLRDVDVAQREGLLAQTRHRMSTTAPAIDTWPHFEIVVSQLPDGATRLHLNVDMMIADLFSMGIVFEEWGRFYEDPNVELPALKLSYRDYLLAERALATSPAAEASRQYWRDRMHRLPPPPTLPRAEMVDPELLRAPDCGHRSHRVEPKQWAALKALASRNGLTPATLVCAAFCEVLGRWSKDPAFTINVTQFRRFPLHEDVNGLVGDFTSTALLEVDGTASSSFRGRAQALADQLWKDLDHAHVGGVEVLGELSRERGERVFMPVVFTSGLDDLRPRTAWAGDLRRLDGETSQVLLDCHIHEYDGGLNVVWDVIEEAFPPGLLTTMFDALAGVLDDLERDPASWDGDPLAEQRREAWAAAARYNDTERELGTGLLHTQALEYARANPERPAIITDAETVTYGSFLARVERVASALHAAGVGPGRRVGVMITPGWEGVVGLYATLVSGAAYVTIDPESPSERLRYSLEQADIDIVLTLGWLGDTVEWPEGVQLLFVDELATQPLTSAFDVFEARQGPADLAYIIYTSGSTGRPKGVMIQHQGARNTCVDINQRFDVGPNDRVFAVSRMSFDLSVYDVFGVLGAGGALVYPEISATPDPARWARAIREHRVTVWNSVPALMGMLVDQVERADDGPLETLRVAMLSGDWIPLTLPPRVRSVAPTSAVISLGGATEASIWSIMHPIGDIEPDWPSVPYGSPLTNQRFYVLDRELQPCPTWTTGELYIGGAGVALGYVGAPDLTRERFIIHPETGERLYRTGDLGCFRSDGTIQFQGREDAQVKVRGFRIELGEIQSQIDRHPTVQESLVVVQSLGDSAHPAMGGADARHIVAYVVGADGDPASEATIRAFLKDELPEHMVPTRVVPLDAIPLTPNGKVNRKALPAIDFGARGASTATKPATALERTIVEIWSGILSLASERFGVEANFFDVGGTSLMMVRLAGEIEEATGVKLGVLDLFELSTVRKMAQAVDHRGAAPVDNRAERANARAQLRRRRRRGRPPVS